MDGIHDLGGMQGFGAIDVEADEPFFHAEWEKRVFALSMATPFVAGFDDDHFRRQIEQISPRRYLDSSYYQLWMDGLIAQMREQAIVSNEELDQATSLASLPEQFDSSEQAQAAGLLEIVFEGESRTMPDAENCPHRFKLGERVGTLNHISSVHTRLPRYARGKTGTVIAEQGNFIFSDSNSIYGGPEPQMLYTVEFSADELWGAAAETGDSICLDLWDAYLEPVE